LRTVLIAMPVARATAATPPQPIAPASIPDHSRRARSSIVACNRHHFWRTTFSALAPMSTVDHVGPILSIPCEVASGSGNASVGLSTLATCPVLRRSSQDMRSWYVFSGERRWPSGTIPSTAQRTARLLVPGFELADHSLGLVVEGGEDLVGVLFRVVKSQAADSESDDFMAVPRPRPGCREARPTARTVRASHPPSRRWHRRELPSRDRVRAGPAASCHLFPRRSPW